ncbi:MAG: dependent oxidoreductase [Acidimicrobiales bacterium]|nr:dependent oxidoreductase [Acidimicrobiales bacterium]
MTKAVVVVGGGLVGLATSLMLSERGAEVTIVERNELGSGASRGNAGFMCTTLLEPLAAPGAVKSALTSLNDPTRALRVHARALPGMVGWGMHFARSATQKRYVAGRVALAKLNLRHTEALELLGTLGTDITLGPELVVPFKDPALAEHYLSTLAPMADYGVELPQGLLDGDELRRIVPALADTIRAGYVVKGDHSVDPRVFVDSMMSAVRSRKITVIEHARVTSVGRSDRRVNSITTTKGTLTFDEVILAAGAGSRPLGKLFDLRIAVVPGQGYNVGLPVSDALTHPVIFEEAHAVATPFADRIRLGGTMEFDGLEPRFDQRRVDAILASMRQFINLDFDAHFDTWSGSRPMSPDGLPLMGRPRQYENVVIAAGHGMFGLSLTPTSALALTELVLDGRSSIDLADFDPDRFRIRNLVAAAR